MKLTAVLALLLSPVFAAEPTKTDPPAKPEKKVRSRPRVRVTEVSVYYGPRYRNSWAWLAGNIAGAVAAEVLAERRAHQYEMSAQASAARNSGAGYGNTYSSQRQIGDDVNPAPAVKKPAEGPLATFTSDPPGAEVRIDGQYAGTTPTAEIRAKEGPHRVTIRLAGYLDWSGDVLAVPGEVAAIRADLEPAPVDANRPKISGLN